MHVPYFGLKFIIFNGLGIHCVQEYCSNYLSLTAFPLRTYLSSAGLVVVGSPLFGPLVPQEVEDGVLQSSLQPRSTQRLQKRRVEVVLTHRGTGSKFGQISEEKKKIFKASFRECKDILTTSAMQNEASPGSGSQLPGNPQ